MTDTPIHASDFELEAGLVCRDPMAMQRFCTQVLGFVVTDVLDFPSVGSVVKLRRGRARLKLFGPAGAVRAAQPETDWYAPGGWRYSALYVPERRELSTLVDAIVSAGGKVVVPLADHRPGSSAALVTDPEGNHWELLWESGVDL